MATKTTTQGIKARIWRGAVLLSLALGAVFSAAKAPEAEAAFTEKIVFASNRTTGTGVNNPTGDFEIFKMNPDGTGVRQLTFNAVYDSDPALSPDGTRVAYTSDGVQSSNPEGDSEIYRVNTLDGSEVKNLSNNAVGDYYPVFSPDSTRIAYRSGGEQTSNPEGDNEIYSMNTLDGKGKKNLSNTDSGVDDYDPVFSPDGTKVAYWSEGAQTLNPEGEPEVFRVNASDGTGKKNLSNNGADLTDYDPAFSPDGTKIAYRSRGIQTSNSQGDTEVYRMNALDGKGKVNLSNNTSVTDARPVFSPDGKTLAYLSYGGSSANPEGDYEVFRMSALDGSEVKNLSNNAVDDEGPVFSPDGTRIAYHSEGVQTLNPEGDREVFRMNALDGTRKKNLSNNGLKVNEFSAQWGRQ